MYELVAVLHEGLKNAQRASPDGSAPDAFLHLSDSELALSSRVKEVLDWIDYFFSSLNGENHSSHAFCAHCIQTATLPSPSTLPDIFQSIQLDNAFTSRIARETLINSSLREVAKEVDDWRSSQASLFLRFITDSITSSSIEPETIANDAANLHPDL